MPNGTLFQKSFKNGMITLGLGFRQPRVLTTKIQVQISAGINAKKIIFGVILSALAHAVPIRVVTAYAQQ